MRRVVRVSVTVLGLALPLLSLSASPAQTPKAGAWLNARLREDLPQGFAIHETSTISTMWPAMPCFNNLVLFEPDDPDSNFYENYGCTSLRNYSRYCDDTVAKLIDQQSQELDRAKRLALVQEIQRRLEAAAVRPVLVWRLDYFSQWPYVKNLVPHHSLYSWGRLQEVWLDK